MGLQHRPNGGQKSLISPRSGSRDQGSGMKIMYSYNKYFLKIIAKMGGHESILVASNPLKRDNG